MDAKGEQSCDGYQALAASFLAFVRLAQAWSFINSQMKAMVNLSILRIATMMLMIWHGRLNTDCTNSRGEFCSHLLQG